MLRTEFTNLANSTGLNVCLPGFSDWSQIGYASRLCFASFDPQLYFHPHALELATDASCVPIASNKGNGVPVGQGCRATNATERQRIAEEVVCPIRWEDATTGFCECPADSRTRWLADALACAATGGSLQRRRLYTNSELVTLWANAWLIVTSASPSFASNAGLADSLLLVRTHRVVGESSDAALVHVAEIIAAALQRAEADKSAFCLENDAVAAALLACLRTAGTFTGMAAGLRQHLIAI